MLESRATAGRDSAVASEASRIHSLLQSFYERHDPAALADAGITEPVQQPCKRRHGHASDNTHQALQGKTEHNMQRTPCNTHHTAQHETHTDTRGAGGRRYDLNLWS